ncbi:hypothetical protein DX932_30310 [Bacillus cereus]|uniref:Uncharacterized protein n=1 Tax=Bacillus cereus TaxID=1396 RepID=A0A9W7UNP8_BACCE|nr:hypothetical protein [Bacillus cereus]KAA6449232.1 hypothetical protein DX932_30310 [Bacillus cereus]
MSLWSKDQPTHLSIFVTDPETGQPTSNLPLYAEVTVPKIIPIQPLDGRLASIIISIINDVDPQITQLTQETVISITERVLPNTIDIASFISLNHYEKIKDLFKFVFKNVLEMSKFQHFSQIKPDDLEEFISTALRNSTTEFNLILIEPPKETNNNLWADPLGVLTTDHVGYASFDLKRLRPEVRQRLSEAIHMRRNNSKSISKIELWIQPYGQKKRFEVLAQARFSFDSVVACLSIPPIEVPIGLNNLSLKSLQNPSLTDWRLSPASFAASPKTLLGADGCEELLPANLALKEFVLRQVVRLTDQPDIFGDVPIDCKPAYIDEYKVSWYSLGHSLGEILYSLPLAPAETVKLAVIDWSWDSLTKRDENTKMTEELLHQTHRDRIITETMKAGIKEMQNGSSFMGGTATSAGATGGLNMGMLGIGAAIGNSWSIGGASSTSKGSREFALENVQRLSDSFSQASSAQREINSTVVLQARQEEKESIQTRTFTNYNHSHTLTILYYEVLRHYRVTVEWVRRRPALLMKIPNKVFTTSDFETTKEQDGSIKEINFKKLITYRFQLEPVLLDPTLKAAFDALEKQDAITEYKKKNSIPSTQLISSIQPWSGDIEFVLFEIGIWTRKEHGTNDTIVAYIIQADEGLDNNVKHKRMELHYVYKGPNGHSVHDINSGENNAGSRFGNAGVRWTVLKPFDHKEPGFKPVKWKDIIAFQFEKWGNGADWAIDALQITAFDKDGFAYELTKGGRYEVDLYFGEGSEPQSQSFSFINRPGLRPTPDLSLAEERLINKLIEHFKINIDYYNQFLLFGIEPNSIAIQMEGKVHNNKSYTEIVEPTPLEVFGDYIAYPLAMRSINKDTLIVELAAALNGNDPNRRQWATSKLAALPEQERENMLELIELASTKSERLITVPTRGVFAEGKLGHCNISEEIDNTRFWKWEEHPIPFEAPDINPVNPIQPQPQQTTAQPTAFPQSLVNIVNPTPAPDPTGLTSAMNLLGQANIFRDMSGRQDVAEFLKRLSDNTIGIAEAANKARELQSKYGTELDKNEKGFILGQNQIDADVAKEIIKHQREEAQQIKPNEAHDAIKLSESETRKGNKTPEEHKAYSKQVQENIKGASPKKKKSHIKLQINLQGYGPRPLIGRFGINVQQRGKEVGFLLATDRSDSGILTVEVLNDYDDNRYDVKLYGEVLAGVGINAELKGQNTVTIPRSDFDLYDYFYLKALAKTDSFEYLTTKSEEVVKEVAEKLGSSIDLAFKSIISMKVEGGMEWKDGKSHTSQTAVKVNVVYYTGGFTISYDKGDQT